MWAQDPLIIVRGWQSCLDQSNPPPTHPNPKPPLPKPAANDSERVLQPTTATTQHRPPAANDCERVLQPQRPPQNTANQPRTTVSGSCGHNGRRKTSPAQNKTQPGHTLIASPCPSTTYRTAAETASGVRNGTTLPPRDHRRRKRSSSARFSLNVAAALQATIAFAAGTSHTKTR